MTRLPEPTTNRRDLIGSLWAIVAVLCIAAFVIVWLTTLGNTPC